VGDQNRLGQRELAGMTMREAIVFLAENAEPSRRHDFAT